MLDWTAPRIKANNPILIDIETENGKSDLAETQGQRDTYIS